MSSVSRYLQHRQGAAEHRAAEQLAREAHCPVQERAFHAGAHYHATAATQQLASARRHRLPRGYFSDAPSARP